MNENRFTTFSDGCLGSRNDEERSEMRYVMRIATLVNHQIFERTLRFYSVGAFLFEYLFSLLIRHRMVFEPYASVYAVGSFPVVSSRLRERQVVASS